jgi:hypothetical protein
MSELPEHIDFHIFSGFYRALRVIKNTFSVKKNQITSTLFGRAGNILKII